MFSRAKNVKVRVFPLFRGDAMNRRSLEHFIIEYFKDEDIQDFKIGEMIYVKVEKIEPAEALHTDRHTSLDLTVQEDGMDVEKFCFVKRPDENIDESLISSDLAKAYLSLFRNGKEPWKKILLSGEPGTGKTLFAHELLASAQQRGLKTYSIPASMLLGEYIGDTIRVINSVKRAVGKDCVLFIDDCDLILHNRNDMKSFGSLLESVVAFLNFIDEFEGYMIAASNDREIDPAIENRMFGIRFDLPSTDLLYRFMKKTDPTVTPREANSIHDKRGSYRDAQKYQVMKLAGMCNERKLATSHDPLYR